MARNPVTPVQPVDPVGAVRRVDSGATYYRHLDEWRAWSASMAAERRARQRALAQSEPGSEAFASTLASCQRTGHSS